jgi:solute carrier family 35 protein E3
MSVATPLLIACTITTSTTMIMTNKMILSRYKFQCPTFLTAFHFLFSSVCLRGMVALKVIERHLTFPSIEGWKIALFGVGGIGLMNWNLKVNSIGFYQLSKLCTIPYMVLYKFFVRGETTSLKLCSALFILLIGLALFTVNDVEMNLLGTFLAAGAVVSTAQSQIMVSAAQREQHIASTQLNFVVMPRQFVICTIAALLVETSGPHNIIAQPWCLPIVIGFLATGMIAVVSNMVGYAIMGRLGPVTWQVVGHVKTMLIFVIGLILFPTRQESPSQRLKKIIGLVVAMGGVVLYTAFEMQAKAKEGKPSELQAMLEKKSKRESEKDSQGE